MKKLISLILTFACLLSRAACTHRNKEQPLSYWEGAQKIVESIAEGDLESAWYPVYTAMAESELEKKFELYAEMFNGHEVKRCDCYDYEKTGDRSVENELYAETTYYKIYLTENYSDDPDYYVKAIGISDRNGDGIISLEILKDCPWQ